MLDEEKDFFTRESEWEQYDGNQTPIKNLNDAHILNLLGYLSRKIKKLKDTLKDYQNNNISNLAFLNKKGLEKNLIILKVINEEIDIRKLDRSKADGEKSLPFKKNGVWMEWLKNSPRPTPVPLSIAFINPIEDKVKNLKLKD